MPTKPTFHERIEQLEDAAKALNDAAATIMAEVVRMAAAEKRFADRRGDKRERRAH